MIRILLEDKSDSGEPFDGLVWYTDGKPKYKVILQEWKPGLSPDFKGAGEWHDVEVVRVPHED